MVVEFRTDASIEYAGFSASIQFTQLQSRICESWLDMNEKTLLSPNYPNFYDNITSCNWLITVRHRFHIELQFQEFNASVLRILITLFINKRFARNEMFQQNASKFAIFYV